MRWGIPSVVAVLAVTAMQVATAAEITVASFPDLDRVVKAVAPQWNKLHPDMPIKLVSLQVVDHHNSMTTALAAGAHLPDVMAITIDYMGVFAESRGLEDLNAPPYNAGQYRDRIVAYTFAQATNSRGNLAAMPTDVGPGMLFYRKDLMDKAGVTEADLTRSWESFIASGRKLKAATGAYLLARAADLTDIGIRSNLQPGEGLYFDSTGKSLVESPRFIRAFELAKEARKAGLDAQTIAWTSEWAEDFKRGRVASQVTGAWLSSHLEKWLAPESRTHWRTARIPEGASAFYGGSFYAIPKKAANKLEAWEFVKYLTTNKEVQLLALRTVNAFPALLAAQDDPMMDEPQAYFGGQKTRRLAAEIARSIPPIPVNKYDAMAADIVKTELENVLEDGKDIRTALRDARTLIDHRAHR